MAVDTLGLLLDLLVTPANEQERRQVEALGKAVQRATDNSVTTAFADQGYTGGQAEGDARKAGMELAAVKPPEAKEGLRPPAQTLGGGAQFCLDGPLSPSGPGL